MNVKLYALPGSHPCAAVEVALRLKSIDYQRIDLLPLTQLAIGPLRYGGNTVPGLRIDGERLAGSRTIMRRLDALAPEPPLLPPLSDAVARARVLEAERWGDEVLQSVPRRILDAAWLRDAASMESYAGDTKMPLPRPMLRPALPLTAKLMAKRNKADDTKAKADLAALPAQLEHIDAWIADGVLGGDRPNAADLQIGSSIRLLMTIADVRPLIEGHKAESLTRWFEPQAGEVPAGTLPAQWLPAPTSA
ncbi:MAG TPA: glutathione S-transferase N-terminal domain-containing protein [Solirubrobacteraceae bacterium]|jgi:glutathione S-transferase|nr:glutathione S-transferase N-terminal domain-containing protein [Solirubrobacteraceae bacterium]